MPNRILILTFYFPPDLCAGSFRAGALVEALRERYGSEILVDVMTTMPNRYRSFRRAAAGIESDNGIVIERFPVNIHESEFVDQSWSFLGYAKRVMSRVKGKEYDVVFATSSRLMTAVLAATVARKADALLYLDVRDLFVDTMRDVLRPVARWVFLPAARLLEAYAFRSAMVINIVSPGFKSYFEERNLGNRLRFFTNGIDAEFMDCDFRSADRPGGGRVVMYAGNIGTSQGLDRLIPGVARQLAHSHVFRVVGDGSARTALVDACSGLENVSVEPPVSRQELKSLYAEADVLLIHLNDYGAFRKVLPSKIFEYAATGKPILAGVAGFASEFVQQNVENAAVFAPCDVQGLVGALSELRAGSVPRAEFKAEFARHSIMSRLADDVVRLLRGGSSQAAPAES